MNTSELPAEQPVHRGADLDPAYDFAEEVPPGDWDEEDDALDGEERVVPLDPDEFRESGEAS